MISHPATASPDSRSTASQIEFATGTGAGLHTIPLRKLAHRLLQNANEGFLGTIYFAKETGDFDERKIPDVDQIDLAFASFDHIVPTASL